LGISSVLESIDTLKAFCGLLAIEISQESQVVQFTYSSDDLMKMGRRVLAGIDQGVQTLDGQARAAEPKQCVGGRAQPKGGDESAPLHLGCDV